MQKFKEGAYVYHTIRQSVFRIVGCRHGGYIASYVSGLDKGQHNLPYYLDETFLTKLSREEVVLLLY